MALEVQWSPKALERFHEVINYLDKNWGNKVAKDFVKRTEILIQTLIIQPKIFRTISTTLELREAIVTKHNLVIYKIKDNKLMLLTFFDTRQHPKKKFRKT